MIFFPLYIRVHMYKYIHMYVCVSIYLSKYLYTTVNLKGFWCIWTQKEKDSSAWLANPPRNLSLFSVSTKI